MKPVHHTCSHFDIRYLILLPIGIATLFVIHKEKMPAFTQTETIIKIDWNENINAGENKFRISQLLRTIQKQTLQSNAFIGRQQFLLDRDQEMDPSEARIYIKSDSPDKIEFIQSRVKKFVNTSFPKAIIDFEPPTSIFERLFSSSEPPLIAQISMINSGIEPDIPQLLKTSGELNSDRLLLTQNKLPLQEHLQLTVDLEKLLLYDVSYEALLKELRTGMKENNIGTLRSYQRFIPIVISGKEMMVSDMLEKGRVTNNGKRQFH